MQIDFHYNIIKVLAEKAGFNPKESEIIAYASQYVDDSVYWNPKEIYNIPKSISSQYSRYDSSDYSFDPICTAHHSLGFLTAKKRVVQDKVYIPFHFIPEIIDVKGTIEYQTTKNSSLAREIVDIAIKELDDSTPKNRTRKLIKLGISLHSFADTWAHQHFSGRESNTENNVSELKITEGITTSSAKFIKNILFLIRNRSLFEIGHGKALTLPDLSHIQWNYKDGNNTLQNRNNTTEYLEASKTIYTILCTVTNRNPKWKKIRNKLKEYFSSKENKNKEKIKKLELLFPEMKKRFKYKANSWEKSAFKKAKLSHENFIKGDFRVYDNEYNGDNKWYYFHIEALAQREFVMKKIKSSNLNS